MNAADNESRGTFCRGVIVIRELARRHSNHRAEGDLDALLASHGVPGIAGIDTRRLTRLIRDDRRDARRVRRRRRRPSCWPPPRREPGTDGVDLVAQVTTPAPYTVDALDASNRRRIVAYDFGIKRTIVRQLSRLGTVEVVPASDHAPTTSWPAGPTACSCQNGPGDPAMVQYARSRRSPSCSATSRCSGSASATSCSGGRSARTR